VTGKSTSLAREYAAKDDKGNPKVCGRRVSKLGGGQPLDEFEVARTEIMFEYEDRQAALDAEVEKFNEKEAQEEVDFKPYMIDFEYVPDEGLPQDVMDALMIVVAPPTPKPKK